MYNTWIKMEIKILIRGKTTGKTHDKKPTCDIKTCDTKTACDIITMWHETPCDMKKHDMKKACDIKPTCVFKTPCYYGKKWDHR